MRGRTNPVSGSGLAALWGAALVLLSACGTQEAPAARESLKTVAHAAPGTSPDLVVRHLVVPPAATPDGAVQVSFEVCNRMPYAAGAFQVEVRLSTDTDFTAVDPKLVRREVAGLGASLCERIQASVTREGLADSVYHVAAVADADGQVAEEDEANNLLRGTTFAVGDRPDFIVTDVRAPLVAEPYQPFVATARVCNQGAVSNAVDVHFLLSDEPTFSGNPWELGGGSAGIVSLDPGVCQDVQFEVTHSNGWLLYVGVKADAMSFVPELDETNNLRVAGQLKMGAYPELVVTEVSAPAGLLPDTAFNAWVTVCNQGTQASISQAAVHVLASVDEDFNPAVDRDLDFVWVEPLAAGQCARRRLQVPLPGLPAGDWYLGATADILGYVGEAFEDNNLGHSRRIRVGQAPDFIITALETTPSYLVHTQPPTRVTVCNQGNVGAPADVGIYLSADEELFLPEPSLGNVSLGFLEAGQCVTREVAIEGFLQVSGIRYVVAQVDPGGVWAELDEENNLRTGTRMMLGGLLDLAVTAFAAPASVHADTPFLARATVCNYGHAFTPEGTYLYVDFRRASQSPGANQSAGYVVVPQLSAGSCIEREVSASIGAEPFREPVLLEARVAADFEPDPLWDNNVSSPALPLGVGAWPDFTVTSVVAPASARPGQSFTTAVTVCNQGTEPGSTDVTVVLSQDASISVQDLFAGWAETGLLQPGQCVALEVPSHAGSLWPGIFTVGAVVDPYEDRSAMNELREDNNVLAGAPMGLGSMADFRVTSVAGPASVQPGASFTVAVTVCNQGTMRAGTDVAFVLSHDDTLSGQDPSLGGGPVGELDPGQCATRELALTAPASETRGVLGARVDSLDLHVEPREDDNARAGGVLAVGSGPDLAVSFLEAPPAIVLENSAFVSKVRVCNQGTAPAGSTELQLMLSRDRVFDSNDRTEVYAQVEPLAPGQCVALELARSNPYGWWMPNGGWYWGARVNPYGDPVELRTDNNVDSRPLEVGWRQDFAVTALELPPSVLPGASFTARVTVCNQGTFSGATQVRLTQAEPHVTGGFEGTLGQVDTGTLEPGACVPLWIQAQAGLSPEGVYTVAAVADPARTTEEAREDNNVRTARLGVGELPDFTITGVTVPEPAVVNSQEITVAVRVCNEGTAAGGTDVALVLSEDAVITASDMPLHGVPVDSLEPGLCTTVDVPVSPWTGSAGTWFVGALADIHGGAAELREDNNASPAAALGVGPLPDFTVTQVRVPAMVQQASSFTLTLEVCNAGTVAGDVEVSLYLSADAEVTPADLLLETVGLGTLPGAGACTMVEVPLQAWMEAREAGSWHVGAIADVARARQELSETNNAGPVARLDIGLGVDLVVSRVVAPASLRPGEALRAEVTVCNQGTAQSGSAGGAAWLSPSPSGNPRMGSAGVESLESLRPGECATSRSEPDAIDVAGTWYLVSEAILWSGFDSRPDNNRGPVLPVRIGLLPDFTVTGVQPRGAVLAGAGLQASVTVCNQGTEPGETDVRLFLSRDAGYSREDVLSSPVSTGPLPAGGCATRDVLLTAPATDISPWYLGAIADRDSQVPELAEDNNVHAGVPVGIGLRPDFIVSVVQAPPSATPGATLTVSVSVCNQGTAAGATDVSFHLSLDGVITRDDPWAGDTLPVASLEPGACALRTQTVLANVGQREGTWYLGAVVDPARATLELLESNNASPGRLLGVGLQPDLVVSVLETAPIGKPHSRHPYAVTVCNQGTAASGQAYLAVHFARRPELPANAAITHTVGPLPPGGCAQMDTGTGVELPEAAWGPLYLTAMVDPFGYMPELIKSNNTRIGPRVDIVDRAELVMGPVQAPASVDVGMPFTASAEVCNQGFLPAEAVVAFHRSTDAQVTVDDSVLGTASLGTLAPGLCATASVQATVSVGGSFFVAAIADGAGVVAEYNETDNVGPASALRAVGPGPDFSVPSLQMRSVVEPGASMTVDVRVCNLGLASAETGVGVYLSTDAAVDTTDTPLYVFDKLFLAAGQCSMVHLGVRSPSVPGRWYVAAIADPLDGLPESDEGNNVSPVQGLATGLVPDLTVVSLKAPAAARQNGSLPVSVTVCNTGNDSSALAQAELRLMRDVPPTQGSLGMPGMTVPALNPGQCVLLEQDVGNGANAELDWRLVAIVDPQGSVSEAFEDNNTREVPLRVGNYVELAVTRVTSPTTLPAGGRFTAEVTVCNSGSVTASELAVELLLADAPDAPGVSVGTRSFSIRRECAVLPVEGTVPPQGLTGELYLKARAELRQPAGRELRLDDNTLTGPRVGIGSGPDLTVKSVKAPARVLSSGATVTASMQVCNEGRASAVSSRLKLVLVPEGDASRTPVTLTTLSTPPLTSGQCTALERPVTLPVSGGGPWRMEVSVDSEGTVQEAVEGNNTLVSDVLWVGSQPTLAITAVQVPAVVPRFQQFTTKVSVCNTGTTAQGGGVPLLISLQTEDGFPVRSYGPFVLSNINAMSCVDVSVLIFSEVPQDGAWRLDARLGDKGMFPEELEGTYSASVTLGVGTSRPEFVITGVTAPTSVTNGVSYTTSVTVCNQGTGTGSARVEAYVSRDERLDRVEGDWLVGQLSGVTFSVGQCRTLPVSSRASVPSGGVWFVGASVVGTSSPEEAVPGNNARVGARITINP